METSKTEKRGGELTLREAMLPAKVSGWRAKLSTKAKQEKRFRFYSLYGLISHAETLKGAWQQVRANGGAAGVDRISIEQIERQGPERWLEALGQELQEQTYRCEAVAPSLYTQSQRQAAAPWDPDGEGSSGASGGAVDLGADLRSRL